MAEYINREKALADLKESADHHAQDSREWQLLLRDRNILREQATVDVKPIIHAKWERVGSSSLIDPYRCSNCHEKPCKKQIEELKTWGWNFTDYCPHCGAKMDKR